MSWSFRTPLTIQSFEPAPTADSTLICDTDGISKWMPRSVLYAGDVNNIFRPFVMFHLHTQAVGCCNVDPNTGTMSSVKDLSMYDNQINFLASFSPTTDNDRRIISIAVGSFKGLSLGTGTCFNTESTCVTIFMIWRRTGAEAANTNHWFFESSGNEIGLFGNANNGNYTFNFDGNSWNTSASTYANTGAWTVTSITIRPQNENVIIRQNCTQILNQAWTPSETQWAFTSGSVSLLSNASLDNNVAVDYGTFLIVDTFGDLTAVQNIEQNLLYQWGAYDQVGV